MSSKIIGVFVSSIVVFLVLGFAVLVASPGGTILAGPPEKHDVCHFDQSGKLHILGVNTGGTSDIQHHANHGDVDAVDGVCPTEPPDKK